MIEFSNVAIVVSHPAHLLTVAGLIQRHHPAILASSSADSSDAGNQARIIKAGLMQLGCQTAPSFLDVDEREAYQWAHVGHWAPFLKIRERLLEWIYEVRPDVVLGDAFECSNYMHDVGRLLLDSALHEYRKEQPQVRNFEFPLVCRPTSEPDKLRFQFFPSGELEEFILTESEAARKLEIIEWALPQSEFIRNVAPLFPPIHIEPLRAIPWDRDYTKIPEGVEKHYDARGVEMVNSGTYDKPIRFEEHFVPLVKEITMAGL